MAVKGWAVVFKGERIQAEILAAVLQADGLRAEVFGDNAYGVGIDLMEARLMVPDDQADQVHPSRLGLEEAKVGVRYELTVTTPAGVWACRSGLHVCFDRLSPLLLRVVPPPTHTPAHANGAALRRDGPSAIPSGVRMDTSLPTAPVAIFRLTCCPADPVNARRAFWPGRGCSTKIPRRNRIAALCRSRKVRLCCPPGRDGSCRDCASRAHPSARS